MKIQDVLRTCLQKGIQKLVVTDHNTISGALQAHRLDPERFIIGEEIMTQQGELLGIFISEEIPPGLPAGETIAMLRCQGAFISVSHPFDNQRKGHWKLADLDAILPYIDAIEVFNSRCLLPRSNLEALAYSEQHHLLGTVGSDAHSLGEIGTATLSLPEFSNSTSLKQALAISIPHTRLSSPWVHFYSRYAAWRKSFLLSKH
jgi:predicted metal-dependent phosphoesterase TrpH